MHPVIHSDNQSAKRVDVDLTWESICLWYPHFVLCCPVRLVFLLKQSSRDWKIIISGNINPGNFQKINTPTFLAPDSFLITDLVASLFVCSSKSTWSDTVHSFDGLMCRCKGNGWKHQDSNCKPLNQSVSQSSTMQQHAVFFLIQSSHFTRKSEMISVKLWSIL